MSRLHKERIPKRVWDPLRWQVIQRDNFTCQACGRVTHRPEVDHITPLHRGGDPIDPGNLQLLCGGPGGCHAEKTARELGQLNPPTPQQAEWDRYVEGLTDPPG